MPCSTPLAATDLLPRLLAQAFALAGRPDAALEWLGWAIERGCSNYPFLARHNPCFRSLRRTPALRARLQIARERWEAFEE